MIETVTLLIERAGYGGIALLMFIETIFPPLPSELILPFAGLSASQGSLSLPLVILASTFGSMAGTLFIYGVAHILHEAHIVGWINRWGKYVGLTQKDFHKAQTWFDTRGYLAVFLCRLVPGIRSLISIPAGVRRMKFRPFFISSLLGTTLWNVVLSVGGYLLGNNYHVIQSTVGWLGKGVYVVGALLIIGLVVYRLVIVPRKSDTAGNP